MDLERPSTHGYVAHGVLRACAVTGCEWLGVLCVLRARACVMEMCVCSRVCVCSVRAWPWRRRGACAHRARCVRAGGEG